MTKKILLIDDDQDFLFQQKAALIDAGFEVLTVETSAAAIEMLHKDNFDLAVMDLFIEKADSGFSLCYQFKKKLPNLPIILVTAITSETGMELNTLIEEEKKWIKADLILTKPILPDQLISAVLKLLK